MWRWQSRLGDRHNLQNGNLVQGKCLADADLAWQTDVSGMLECVRNQEWKLYDEQKSSIEGSGIR